MPLLVAPFPQGADPLGLANITRTGIQDKLAQANLQEQYQQKQQEMNMRLTAQMVADVNDNLWKKRESERRAELDKFNMATELKKLDLMEEENKLKREEFTFLHDPEKNPLLKSQIRRNDEYADYYANKGVKTPGEQEMDALKLREKEAEVATKERTSRYEGANTLNAKADAALEVLPQPAAIDEGRRLLDAASNLPLPGFSSLKSVAPGLDVAAAARDEAAGIKAIAQQGMKENAPLAKPGTIKAPTPAKPLNEGQVEIITNRHMAPVKEAINKNQAALDKARSQEASLNKTISEKEVDATSTLGLANFTLNSSTASKEAKEKAKAEHDAAMKPFNDARKAIKVSIVDEDGNSREVPIAEAEAMLKKMRDSAKVKEFDFRKSLDIPTEDFAPSPPSRETNRDLPTPTANTYPTAQTPNPLLPPVNSVLKGVPPEVQAKILPFLTAEPAAPTLP